MVKHCSRLQPAILAGAALAIVAECGAAEPLRTVLAPADARVTARGKVLENGTFTLWTRGVFGDCIVVPEGGQVTITVSAAALLMVRFTSAESRGLVWQVGRERAPR